MSGVKKLLLQRLNFIRAIDIILDICLNKCHRIRRWWTKPHLKEDVREEYGAFSTIYYHFKENDHAEFYNFVGVTIDQFNILLELVQPKLIKRSRRKALCPELRRSIKVSFMHIGKLSGIIIYCDG